MGFSVCVSSEATCSSLFSLLPSLRPSRLRPIPSTATMVLSHTPMVTPLLAFLSDPPLARTPSSPSLEPHPNLDILQIKMEPGKMQPPPGGSRKRAAGLSLDLNSASAKRNKQVQSLLTSPDVQMLKLTSPELEKFLIQNPALATPTPSGYIFPKSVTEEQAMYAKGFEEALEHLRQSEPPGSNDLA